MFILKGSEGLLSCLGPTTFGIFDAFTDEARRQAHLAGRVAAALMAKVPELLARALSSRRSMCLRPSYRARDRKV